MATHSSVLAWRIPGTGEPGGLPTGVAQSQTWLKRLSSSSSSSLYRQSYGFSGIHVWMWKLDHKEGWAPENWCFWIVILEKTLEGPLDCKEIKPVNSKGNQSWLFIGRTDAEAEALILWPPDAKSQLIRKDPDVGKDWGQKRRGDREWDGWVASLIQWT